MELWLILRAQTPGSFGSRSRMGLTADGKWQLMADCGVAGIKAAWGASSVATNLPAVTSTLLPLCPSCQNDICSQGTVSLPLPTLGATYAYPQHHSGHGWGLTLLSCSCQLVLSVFHGPAFFTCSPPRAGLCLLCC